MKKHIIYFMALFLTGITAIAQIDRSQVPASGPDPEIKLVEPYTFELKNGLKVLVVEDHKLPTVSYSLRIDNPSPFEGDKAGVQSLAGALAGKGTQETSKDDFTEEIDFLGAYVSVSPNGGYASGLSRYKKRILELMAEAAFKPLFTQEELDFEKEQLIEGIKSGENSAEAIAGRVRSALVYGTDHPVGEFLTEESVNNVTLQDVEKFFYDHFKPENAYMVVSGDITPKEAKKLIKKYFKKWEKGTAPAYDYPAVKDVPSTEINFVDVPNAVQTELAIYNTVDLKMNDADYFPALVANYIYGGAFGSYLNMNLREANGYTYGARSSISTNKNYKSTFRATTKVRNEVTDSALVETLNELKRIRTTDVDEEMLSTAKAKFLGNFIMSSEDKKTTANRAIRIETQNLPKDFYKNYIANINAVTKEDVQRVANKYMKIDNLRIILVGKASDVLENLEKMEFEGKKFPIKYYDKYANPTDRPSTIEIPAGVTAQTVLDNYIKAIGGKEAVSNIKSTAMNGVLATPMGEVNVVMKRAMGNKFLQEISMAGNVMQKQVYADGKGKVSSMGQSQELSGDDLKAVADEAMFMPELYATDKATLAGAEKLGDKIAYVIKWSDNKKTYYDSTTGLLLAQETTLEMQGQKISQMLKFQDYKADASGVKFPMTLIQPMQGREMKIEVKEVKVNSDVTDADFQ